MNIALAQSRLRDIIKEVEAGGPCDHWPELSVEGGDGPYCVGCQIGMLAYEALYELKP